MRFDGKSGVKGYDPEKYLATYEGAEGDTPQEKINALRRENYAAHKDEINAQKRAAYAERQKQFANGKNHGILKSGSGEMTIHSIDSPIEQRNTGKGKPAAITHYDVELNNRQQRLLEKLPEFDSRVTVPKDDVSMIDLSALTAKTGDEFALFTKQGERLVIRGNGTKVQITLEDAKRLAEQGYTWSGHTHPGVDFNCLQASPGDMQILKCFQQDCSSIYNSLGERLEFWKE